MSGHLCQACAHERTHDRDHRSGIRRVPGGSRARPPDARTADIVLVNPTDYFLYLPLLPEVAAGILDPRRVTVSLPGDAAQRTPGARRRWTSIDLEEHGSRTSTPRATAASSPSTGGPRRRQRQQAAAHPRRRRARPRLPRHRRGAVPARPHHPADRAGRRHRRPRRAGGAAAPSSSSAPATPAPRSPRRGSSYTERLCAAPAARRTTRPAGCWSTCAPRAARARRATSRRPPTACCASGAWRSGPARRSTEAMDDGVRLSDGDRRADPLAGVVRRRAARSARRGPGPTPPSRAGSSSTSTSRCPGTTRGVRLRRRGRGARTSTRPGEITPDDRPARPAAGQLARPATSPRPSAIGERRPYGHHDLGFVVDLGGWTEAAANPLRVPLSGLPAKVVARGYHLYSLPGNRVRTAASWLTEAAFGREGVQLGLVRGSDVPLDTDTPMGAVRPKA